MRPRDEAFIALGVFALLATAVALAGKRSQPDRDERPSTFLAGPGGARALLEAMPKLGISVRRFRVRPRELRHFEAGRQALFILDPTAPISPPELTDLLSFGHKSDLVLAGDGALPLLECFGYRLKRLYLDSVAAVPPGRRPGPGTPFTHWLLVATHRAIVIDSSRAFDVARISCTVPPSARLDTLLASPGGQPVAVRIVRRDTDREVVLVADAGLFKNRALRETDAGPFVLGLVAGRYDRVLFEEYHHGFGASGSLLSAVIEWSGRSPWGWVAWQLAAVGLLSLLFGAVRFGPARPAIGRTRRSPLEHVRALATALASAKGHDVAIGAMVKGLRRRLLPPALRGRGDWRAWLTQQRRSASSGRARTALMQLETLTRPGQPSSAVLRAANAVEDLWEDLRP